MTTQHTARAAALKEYNRKLPAGITATIHNGKLRWKVMPTTTSSFGVVKRHGLGTFTDLTKAVQTLVEFKVKGYLQGIPDTAEVEAELAYLEVTDFEAAMKEQARIHKEDVAVLQTAAEQLIPGGVAGAFAILNNMPFHEVPTSGDCVTSLEDGTPVTIPAKIVAEWFSSLEA